MSGPEQNDSNELPKKPQTENFEKSWGKDADQLVNEIQNEPPPPEPPSE